MKHSNSVSKKILNENDKKLIDFIKAYIITHKYPPTVREIAAEFNIKSTKTAHDWLKKLKNLQILNYDEKCPRTIVVRGCTISFDDSTY